MMSVGAPAPQEGGLRQNFILTPLKVTCHGLIQSQVSERATIPSGVVKSNKAPIVTFLTPSILIK